jgi:hypothetical protein
MEGLSAAASGIAVVSLAIQLAESIKELYEFWDSVKEAPKEIEAIVKELKLLSAVLDDIQLDQQINGIDPIIVDILDSCVSQVESLKAIVQKLEQQCQSSSRKVRQWAALKASFQKDRIGQFRASLQETKTTLILAQQRLQK